MSVQKGNQVYVPANTLGGTEGQKLTIKWSQSMKSRSEEYLVSKYTNKSGGQSLLKFLPIHFKLKLYTGADGLIFIQANKLNELAAKAEGTERYTFTIDGSWQYGQKKDGTGRFLVYHDKANRMFQVGAADHGNWRSYW